MYIEEGNIENETHLVANYFPIHVNKTSGELTFGQGESTFELGQNKDELGRNRPGMKQPVSNLLPVIL